MEITSNFVAAVLLIWFNCLKTAEPLGGNSLFFTTGDPGTHSLVVEVLDFQSKVLCSKALSDSNFDSAFHPPKVDHMRTRNFWELSRKK